MRSLKRSYRYSYNSAKRRNPLHELSSRVQLTKQSGYNYRDDRFSICESGYTKSQGWGGLYKAWNGFLMNRRLDDREKMNYYAEGIRKIEKDMDLDLSQFPDLRMEALQYASDPENEELLEEEAQKLDKDVDELNSQEILGIMLTQDEKARDKQG